VAKLSAYKSAVWDLDKHERKALKMSHSMGEMIQEVGGDAKVCGLTAQYPHSVRLYISYKSPSNGLIM